MRSLLPRLSRQTWLLLYLGCVVLGAGAFFGGSLFPPEWFSGWQWWKRLLLILLASPVVVPVLAIGYALFEAVFEGLFHVLVFFLREHTLQTIVALVVLVATVFAGAGLLRA